MTLRQLVPGNRFILQSTVMGLESEYLKLDVTTTSRTEIPNPPNAVQLHDGQLFWFRDDLRVIKLK